MPTFMIERNIPDAAGLTIDDLQGIAQRSCAVVDELEGAYTWHHSYVAGDKIYCVHETDDIETVREHARRGGFPADLVVEVAHVFGPQDRRRLSHESALVHHGGACRRRGPDLHPSRGYKRLASSRSPIGRPVLAPPQEGHAMRGQ